MHRNPDAEFADGAREMRRHRALALTKERDLKFDGLEELPCGRC
jgi:hypothetical protein